MSEQKDMILENFLSSAIRTLDTDEIYNILMDSLILLLHPQGLLLTQNLNTGRSFYTCLLYTSGARYGLERSKLYDLGIAAMLHDIGKKFLPEEIANGKWPLEGAEREAWKSCLLYTS